MKSNQVKMFITQNGLLNVTLENIFMKTLKFLSAPAQPWLHMFFSAIHKNSRFLSLSSPLLGLFCVVVADVGNEGQRIFWTYWP